MRHVTITTGEQLVNTLHALGVNFIRGGKGVDGSLHNHPSRVIMALAQSDEARLRLSLISLFLEHPEYESRMLAVSKRLDVSAKLTLKCYYSAAVWISKKISTEHLPARSLFQRFEFESQ